MGDREGTAMEEIYRKKTISLYHHYSFWISLSERVYSYILNKTTRTKVLAAEGYQTITLLAWHEL